MAGLVLVEKKETGKKEVREELVHIVVWYPATPPHCESFTKIAMWVGGCVVS